MEPEYQKIGDLPDTTKFDTRSPAFVGKAEELFFRRLELKRKEGNMAKKLHTTHWNRYNDMYRGNHWPGKVPKHKVPATVNLIQQLVERKAALLTDSRPIIKVTPTIYSATDDRTRLTEEENTAQALEKMIEALWIDLKMELRLARAITFAEIFGCVGFETCWNRMLGDGGDIDINILDPRSVIIDPYTTDSERVNKDYCSYFIIDEYLPTDFLRSIKDFRNRDKICPTTAYADADDESQGLFSKIKQSLGIGANLGTVGTERTLIKRFWLQDWELNTKGERKYPGGRYVITTDNAILLDMPNPYLDNEWPVDFMDWHTDINSVWSFGDVELYENPQQLFNKLLGLVVENAALMTNSLWIMDHDAMAPKERAKLSNIPGGKVLKKRGTDVRRDAPPPMSSGAINVTTAMAGFLEKLSGITEAVEGRRPGQVTSGVAIESLQQAAQTNIRLKSRSLDAVLNSIGAKTMSRIFQYVRTDRVFTKVGDSSQVMAYHFSRKKILDDPNFKLRDFNFNVIPGSSLSLTKWQRGLLGTQLFGLGIIDERAVLDVLEYPDREEILVRMAKKQAAQMQAMAEQQGVALGGEQRGGIKAKPSGGSVPKPPGDMAIAGQQKPMPGASDINTGGSI